MGNGLLTFIDKKTCYNDFFKNNEMIFYTDLDDLTEKIHKYKKDDKYKKVPKWPWIFIIIWVLYGLAYLSKSRDLFYNIHIMIYLVIMYIYLYMKNIKNKHR